MDDQALLDVRNRVFKEILRLKDDSNLHKACAHEDAHCMQTLLGFTVQEITDFTYLEGKQKLKISKGLAGSVFALQGLTLKRLGEGNRIHNDWLNVTTLRNLMSLGPVLILCLQDKDFQTLLHQERPSQLFQLLSGQEIPSVTSGVESAGIPICSLH